MLDRPRVVRSGFAEARAPGEVDDEDDETGADETNQKDVGVIS